MPEQKTILGNLDIFFEGEYTVSGSNPCRMGCHPTKLSPSILNFMVSRTQLSSVHCHNLRIKSHAVFII